MQQKNKEFTVNSVLLLVHAPKEPAMTFNLKPGDIARVVDGEKMFPILREALVKNMADKKVSVAEMDETMTCVTWEAGKKPNGYFHKHRFLKIGDAQPADASRARVN